MKDARCGCCEGTEPLTPRPTENRPGLTALRYRAGTHSTFFETMRARLSSHRLADGRRPLGDLTTRTPDDPSIALLDAWATVADVLTFYQERIANEGYLLTAIERRSILELARLVGYRLRPGVAASVFLAFTLEKDSEIDVPAGTRAQSIPEAGGLPQFFETDEALPARTVWNAIPARQTAPPYLQPDPTFSGSRSFCIEGAVSNLKANDAILFVCGSVQQPYTLQAAEADAEADRTLLRYVPFNAAFSTPAVSIPASSDGSDEEVSVTVSAGRGAGRTATTPALTRLTAVVNALKKDPSLQPASRFKLDRALGQTYHAASDLGPQLLSRFHPRLKDTLYAAYENAPVTGAIETECQVEAFRVKASPFGHNAPEELVFNDNNVPAGRQEWILREFGGTVRVRLDHTDADQGVSDALSGTFDLLNEVNPLRIEVAVADEQGLFADAALFRASEVVTTSDPAFGDIDPVFQGAASLLATGAEVELALHYEGPFDAGTGAYDDAELRAIDILTTRRPGHGTRIRIALPSNIIGTSSTSDTLDLRVDDDPTRSIFVGSNQTETTLNRTLSWSFVSELEITHATPELATEEQLRTISLDAAYDKIAPGSWVVVDRADAAPLVAQVEQARTLSRSDYGISGKVTQLVLTRPWLTGNEVFLTVARGTTVYAESERLALAEDPIEEDVAGGEIELDGLYDGLAAGRWVVVKGVRTDIPGLGGEGEGESVEATELALLAGVSHDVRTVTDAQGNEIELPTDTLHTRLILAEALAYTYDRTTVTVNANVARATHGETQDEILGSGDGTQAFQRFTLKKPPLTYVAAPTPEGVASTLDVRVNEVRWPEQETLLYLGSHERGYETETDNDGRTTIIFGDGTHGARLPTGVENVTAVYRSGIGKGGNVEAGQISVLASRPLGVKEVVNPQRASGGADPESRDQARRNVPLALLALDRLVSVDDYASFARLFAGIGKAAATRLTDGRREIVHLTIAGADDIPIDAASDLYRNLLLALRRFGDPNVPLQVDLREPVFLFLAARVKVHEDYLWENVEPKVRTALLDALSFDRRDLGEAVSLSPIISTVQAIEGVEYVDVDLLDGVSETDAFDPETLAAKLEELAGAPAASATPAPGGCPGAAQPRQYLPVALARIDPSIADPALRIRPAQIAYLNPDLPDTLILTEVTS